MKSIKCLQSIKFDKEGVEFVNGMKDVINAWGLLVPIYKSKECKEKGHFTMEVLPNVIGTVIQYNGGEFECNLNSINFQTEYTDEELKRVIIQDIKEETVSEWVDNTRMKFNEANNLVSSEEMLTHFAENINKLNEFGKEGIELIKKYSNDSTNLD